jgi:hypothetical protein
MQDDRPDPCGGQLPKVPDSRKTERAAVNALRELLDRHGHIVQDIHGENDFGEDLFVTFSAGGQVTGDVIKVQVKGGRSWRRANDYGVPVGDHGDTWSDGNVPVFCVVHDPATRGLYWANATAQLLKARRESRVLRTIAVSPDDVLDDASIADFVFRARHYVSRYQGNQAVRTQLGEMAGAEFGASDIVMHFINRYGEDLIFWQRHGEGYATLLHSDLDWDPQYIGPELLHIDAPFGLDIRAPLIGSVILNMGEALWLAACFSATDWAREPVSNGDPPQPRPEVLRSYVAKRIAQRLMVEPDILTQSIGLLRADSAADPEILAEVAALEADAEVLEEACSASWKEMSPEAQRLASLYLVKDVVVGEPSLPIGQQFRIIWRYQRPWGEYGFSARVGTPSTHLTSQREIVPAGELKAGDRIYWLSRSGNERVRNVSAVWHSDETPAAICVLFDQLSLGDTFWPGELFARKNQSR